jgi:glycosyltransferase 2 family protein
MAGNALDAGDDAARRGVSPSPGSGAGRLPTGFGKLLRTALYIIPAGVLGNLALSYFATDRALLADLGRLPPGYLLAGLALALLPWLTGTLRLLIWTRFLDYGMPFREAVKVTLAVDLGAAVSPTAVGGELFKWGMLVQRGVPAGAAATLSLLPKLEDAIFFAVALPIAFIASGAWRLPVVSGIAEHVPGGLVSLIVPAAAIGLACWLLARLALVGTFGHATRMVGLRWVARARRFLDRPFGDARNVVRVVVRRGKSRFALTLLLTAVHWIARYSVVTMVLAFLGIPLEPLLFWLLQWVVFTAMSFVPTPGAAGGAEAAFSLIYAPIVPAGLLGVATAAWRMLTFYAPVALAAIVFALLHAFSGGRVAKPRTRLTNAASS